MISVIIVTFNAARTLRACLDSLVAHAPAPAEIIVVDNGSTDGTLDILRSYVAQGVKLVRGGNPLCFGAAGNIALRHASHDILYFHAPDACLTGNIFNEMAACLRAHPRLAAIGPRLVLTDGRGVNSAHAFSTPRKWLLQALHVDRVMRPLLRIPVLARACAALPMARGFARTHGNLADPRPLQDADWISGAGLMVRRQAFEEIDGFDPRIFLQAEDEDLCRRLRKAGHGIAFHDVQTPVLLDQAVRPALSTRGVARLRFAARQVFVDKHFTGHQRWLMHGLLYARQWLRAD